MYPRSFSHRYLCRISIAALLLALGSPLPVSAADYTWTGINSSALWTTPLNWSGNVAPIAGTDTRLIFGASNRKSTRNDFADGFTLNTIRFTESGYRIRGNSLSFAGTSPQLVQTVSGTNTVENNLSITSLLTADVQDSNGNLVLSGALSGADATLTKTGLGKLTFTSSSSKTLNQIRVNGGTVALTSNANLTTVQSYIGQLSGTTGTLTVDGSNSVWNNLGNTFVGLTGTGTLAITRGGTVNNTGPNSPNYIGYNPSSKGTVTVDGAGSVWNIACTLAVGSAGTGSLSITNGGKVLTNSSAFNNAIGSSAGSNGTVTVDGTGSQWSSSGTTYVGYGGTGTLAISNGGVVTDSTVSSWVIASQVGSTGTVTVDGAGSQWNVAGNTYVGSRGTGTLTITNGGLVTNNTSYLYSIVGGVSGSTGTVSIDGVGSAWKNSGDTYVGSAGTGTITISSGGLISQFNSILGQNSGSKGTATVDGVGSQWTSSGDMRVGYSGTGILAITNGGAVNAINAFIGHQSGSSGSATVDGVGSQWNTTDTTNIGYGGTGTLTIKNGGQVKGSYSYIGRDPSSNGSVTVDGTGSTWDHSSYLIVGDEGTGTLTISNGGTVNNNYAWVGDNNGGSGSVIVRGTGSTWNTTGTTNIGYSGNGTLSITRGGTINGNDGSLGENYGSDSSATVDGAGSTWNNTGRLYIGGDGTGALTISHAGTVNNADGYIGNWYQSSGNVTVTDKGSVWNSPLLYVAAGTESIGTLTITKSGTVNSENAYIGYGSSGVGNVTVDGIDSVWNNTNDLAIGVDGTGTLNITRQGVVIVGGQTSLNSLSFLKVNDSTLKTATLTGTGTITLTGGSGLTLNQTGDSTFDGAINGNGTFRKTGAGTLTLTKNSTRLGDTIITQGGLTFSGARTDSRQIEVQNGATLKATNGATLNLGSGSQLRANTGSTVSYDNATIVGGTITGSGAQSVTGAGAIFNATQFANTSNLTTSAVTNLISVTNRGTITANSGADIKARDFNASNGKLNINAGAKFTNTGTSALTLSNGSQTNIGTKEAPGGTLDSGGKDILLNGGILVNNGEVTGGGSIDINSNATLKGSGDFTGMTVNIGSGGVFSPGNSPGIATAGDMIWGAGGTMLWEINDATGNAGVNYDFTSLSGSLSIQSGNNPFTISLSSLLPNNTGGALTNFDPTKDYTWTLLHADNGISGFDSADVTLSTQFFNVFNPGVTSDHFNVEINTEKDTLKLNYVAVNVVVPESNSSYLFLIGVTGAGVVMLFRLRQKTSSSPTTGKAC